MAEPLKVEFSGKLPGEELAIRVLDFVQTCRESMDPAVRGEWDKIALEDYKQWRAFWAPLIQNVLPH